MREGYVKNVDLLVYERSDTRYLYTPKVYDTNKKTIYSLFVKHGFVNTNDSIYHIVRGSEDNRLDLIANKYYSNPQYWWMIAMANNIIDPFVLVPGTTIIVPNIDAFYQDADEGGGQ